MLSQSDSTWTTQAACASKGLSSCADFRPSYKHLQDSSKGLWKTGTSKDSWVATLSVAMTCVTLTLELALHKSVLRAVPPPFFPLGRNVQYSPVSMCAAKYLPIAESACVIFWMAKLIACVTALRDCWLELRYCSHLSWKSLKRFRILSILCTSRP